MSRPTRPYDPAQYMTVAEVLAYAATLEDRVEALEGALRGIIAHDDAMIEHKILSPFIELERAKQVLAEEGKDPRP